LPNASSLYQHNNPLIETDVPGSHCAYLLSSYLLSNLRYIHFMTITVQAPIIYGLSPTASCVDCRRPSVRCPSREVMVTSRKLNKIDQ